MVTMVTSKRAKNPAKELDKWSDSLANEALGLSNLWEMVSHIALPSFDHDERLTAICTAIDSDYPQLLEQHRNAGGDTDAAVDVHTAEKEAWFYIGVAVGKRLRGKE
jgi:hypothetical protein